MPLQTIVAIAPVISAAVAALTFAVAAATFIKALAEYMRGNATKRFELYQKINERFDKDPISSLKVLLEIDDLNLQNVPYIVKHDFLGFYEDIAIMINSKIMRSDVAYYMYGYYAIACWESKNFWHGPGAVNRESPYWELFGAFARRMITIRDRHLGQGKKMGHRRSFNVSKLRF